MTTLLVCPQDKFSDFMKKTQSPIVIILFAASLFFTVAFLEFNAIAGKTVPEEWIRAKKETAITCGPSRLNDNSYIQTKSIHEQNKTNQQDSKDNSNGCSHQYGTGALCNISNSKRRCVKAS
jgi:hypothetical protein